MSVLKLSNPGGTSAPFAPHPLPTPFDQRPAFIGWSTYPTEEAAEKAARSLVAELIVACAQVSGPIRSFYHHEGETTEAVEWRLTLKYTVDHADTVARRLKQTHPYTTPQWIAVRADVVSAEYLAWMTGYAG